MLILFDEKENLAFLTAKSSDINNKPTGNQNFPEFSSSEEREGGKRVDQGLGRYFWILKKSPN